MPNQNEYSGSAPREPKADDIVTVSRSGVPTDVSFNTLARPFLTTHGRTLTVGAFALVDGTGAPTDISESTVTLKASTTQYVCLDLCTLSYVLLDRNYHDGAIAIASVTTSANEVTSIKRLWSGETPKTAIPNTLTKLATATSTSQVRIGILDDSLGGIAGSGTGWTDLLFNASHSGSGYNITGISSLSFDNCSVGSQTSAYGLAMVGEGSYTGSGVYDSTGISTGPSESNKRFSPPKADAGRSPFINNPYDLVIVGFGANGGTYDLLYLENIVTALRLAGSEVLILTKNYRSDNADFLKTRADALRLIADRHGCALADTWMYFLEKERAGSTVFADTVHQAAAGHVSYAEAVGGILSPAITLAAKDRPNTPARVYGAAYQANNSEWARYPNYCQIQFAPSATDGTTDQTTTAASALTNPALAFGGRVTGNAVTTLANTKVAKFAHGYATSVYLIVDGSSTFTCDIKHQNASSTLGSVTFASATSGQVQVLEAVLGGDYCDVTTAFRISRGIQIEVTSGTLKLIGVMFTCDRHKELDILTDVTYTGTWSSEAWIYNHPLSKYSATDGDSFSFSFTGSEAVIFLSSRSSAGKVDIYLNGTLLYNARDLYQAGDYLDAIRIPTAASTSSYDNRLPGVNHVQVKLNGANGSAGASAAANRRLGLLAIQVFDRG
jgi:hypothetical protein